MNLFVKSWWPLPLEYFGINGVTNSNKLGSLWLEQLQMPTIIPEFEDLYLSLYLMAEIATHPYTKWQ